jgi:hypothetical protein
MIMKDTSSRSLIVVSQSNGTHAVISINNADEDDAFTVKTFETSKEATQWAWGW